MRDSLYLVDMNLIYLKLKKISVIFFIASV